MQRCEALFRSTFDAYLPKNVTYCHNDGSFLRVSAISSHRNALKVGIFGGKAWGVMDLLSTKNNTEQELRMSQGGFHKECRYIPVTE